MKVTPSNQTLILASERRAGGDPSLGTSRLMSAAAAGPGLSRVTIVASQPDASFVYFRADYAGQADGQSVSAADAGDALTTTGPAVTSTARTVVVRERGPAASRVGSRDGTLSAYLKPADQYARTQRMLFDEAPAAHIDVRA